MFWNTKILNKLERILATQEETNRRLIALKLIALEDRHEIQKLKAEILQIRNFDLIKKVKKPRKKKLRGKTGFTNVGIEEAEEFVRMYVEDDMEIFDIAHKMERSSATVGRWIHKLTDDKEEGLEKSKSK
jgi:hypothetical protein